RAHDSCYLVQHVTPHDLPFFFSSRRRHTRWPRDWSSDVCSSDLWTMAREGIALVATLIAPEQIVVHGVKAGIPEYAVRKSEAVRGRHLESFHMALRAGVPIAAGTDAGTPLNPHGSIVPELALMVKAGMAPLETIRAATATAARLLGLEHEVGALTPGLAA